VIEINLIPDVKRELLKAQRTRTAVISGSIVVSIVAGAIVVALALYVYGVQTVRGALLDNQIKDGAAKLATVQDLSKILTIQNQLSRISELNSQKNIDSRLFDVLSAVIPPEPNSVQVSLVTVDAEAKTVRIEGQTSGYDSMEVFKKTLDSAIINFSEDGQTSTEKLATDISVSDTSYGANSEDKKVLRFVLTFTYAEKLFSPDVSGVTIKLDANGNVTDSYLGIPKSIFTERATDL
jgi:Tfp pilus assembly protein PilN